ncbi:phosphoribosyl-ATP diphosphatase [Enterococcus caccae]|uniref:Phosphoribosyl-ATP pyrophosphatase n=1 Tax=Enterococcus caccae ATCC BAA-1240 TaxID=1158612 RepID=R3U269_9ENTE|nr:phosphoribosyl-ATP diphosphatase [Enterococcus caccae]EOL47468.1 phosphoribosyl-ATP diphosphatase [Enterococcus caccae ATCC BAA-1240]EOT65675.1 phosphoribosyl-ATP diphosphatase [Enterococcus caccae ATCC BAA-1240]OJG23774.1 phosphoribosyl-ATP diphosphatase [Enterococcus caccae]
MIETLYGEICARKEKPQEGSYTNYLFSQGLDKILKKVGEEATEVIIAAKNNQSELISETSDLIYHMLVLLVEQDVSLDEIKIELMKREGKLSKTKERKQIDDL